MLMPLFNFCNNLGSRIKQWVKPTTAMLVAASLTDMTRSKADLIAENAMLHQQLIVLNRQIKRPQLNNGDCSPGAVVEQFHVTVSTLLGGQVMDSHLKLPSWLDFRIGTWIANKLTRFVESRTPPDLRLIDMSSAYEQAQCLYVVAKLGVADNLASGPKNIETLARELDVQADPLNRILRYLQQFPFWDQDLTGFRDFCHLWLCLSLDRHFERQFLGKNLSGLVIPGIAALFA
jgi:hypothetical protein